MTDSRRDRDPDRDELGLSPDEQRFVDQLNARFAPPPLSAPRRAALDARVRERIERPRWTASLVTGLVAFAALALAFLVIPRQAPTPTPSAAPAVAVAEPPEPDAWERQIFFDEMLEGTDESGEPGLPLPAGYAAIDSLFFDS